MIEKKEFRKSLLNLISTFDDNSAKTAESLYEVLEEVYYQYQNEAIERFCMENH